MTFADGEYLNASLDDDVLLEEFQPFNLAIVRIWESLDAEQDQNIAAGFKVKLQAMIKEVFDGLKVRQYGLPITDACISTLEEF